MYSVNEKEGSIVEAAVRVISRYGVRRTTMNDIASEAAISRQTLYNFFSNKDEVLRGTIRHMAGTAVAAVTAEWRDAATLGEKLDILFRHVVVMPFELIHAMPDADDIVSGFNAAGKEEIAKAHEQYRLLIEEALSPHEAAIRNAGLNPRQLSDFACNAAMGFKHDARDKEHLLQLLDSLNVLVLNVADST